MLPLGIPSARRAAAGGVRGPATAALLVGTAVAVGAWSAETGPARARLRTASVIEAIKRAGLMVIFTFRSPVATRCTGHVWCREETSPPRPVHDRRWFGRGGLPRRLCRPARHALHFLAGVSPLSVHLGSRVISPSLVLQSGIRPVAAPRKTPNSAPKITPKMTAGASGCHVVIPVTRRAHLCYPHSQRPDARDALPGRPERVGSGGRLSPGTARGCIRAPGCVEGRTWARG